MRNIAVILAGGTGSRTGLSVPKQFWRLPNGRTLLESCVAVFETCKQIDEIVVVMHEAHIAEARQLLNKPSVTVIAGGQERWESSWNAVKYLSARREEVNVLLHDCARPFVSLRILDDVCNALKEHKAVTVAVPVTDTLYKVESGERRVESVPQRDSFMRAQTPQSFRLSLIEQAYKCALQDPNGVAATDDCGIVKTYMPDEHIYIIKGEENNRKLTYKEDFV